MSATAGNVKRAASCVAERTASREDVEDSGEEVTLVCCFRLISSQRSSKSVCVDTKMQHSRCTQDCTATCAHTNVSVLENLPDA